MGRRQISLLLALSCSLVLVVAGTAGASPPSCADGATGFGGAILDERGDPITDTVSVGWTNLTTSEADGDAGVGGVWQLCLQDGASYRIEFFADLYRVRTIQVTADGATKAARDVTLLDRPQLVGRVVSAGSSVGLFTSIGVDRVGGGDDGEASQDDGTFRLFVEPGEYVLSFGADGHHLEYYDDAYQRSAATAVEVTSSDGRIDLGTIRLRPCDREEICTEAPPTPTVSSFADVPDGDTFVASIERLANTGITRGCNPPQNTEFCPDAFVTREQMAAFVDRALGLPDAPNTFTDTQDSVFGANIGALAGAGITRGCNPPDNTRYCPDVFVTRAEMAAFLDRALDLPDAPNTFTDTQDSVFGANIGALAGAGITRGCNPPDDTRFCPDELVTREQMAAFIDRAGLT